MFGESSESNDESSEEGEEIDEEERGEEEEKKEEVEEESDFEDEFILKPSCCNRMEACCSHCLNGNLLCGLKMFSFFFFIKALLATLGGVIFWVGSWNLLDVYILPASFWSELGCVFVGTLLLFLTRTFLQQAGLVITQLPLEYEEIQKERDCHYFLSFLWHAKTKNYIRCFIAIWGSVILWKGVYNIFDLYIYKDTLTRTMVYVFVGLFLLTITNTLSTNVGLSPVSLAGISVDPLSSPRSKNKRKRKKKHNLEMKKKFNESLNEPTATNGYR